MQLTRLLCFVDMHGLWQTIFTKRYRVAILCRNNPFSLFTEVTTASPYTCYILQLQPHLIFPIYTCTIFHQIFYNINMSCLRCDLKCTNSILKQDFTIIKHFITFKWVRICLLRSLILESPIFCVCIYCVKLRTGRIYIVWQCHVICTVFVLVVEIF